MSTKIIISEDKSFIQELLNRISENPVIVILNDTASIKQLIENYPGCIVESTQQLKGTVTSARNGLLTYRETEVLKLIGEGKSTKQN